MDVTQQDGQVLTGNIVKLTDQTTYTVGKQHTSNTHYLLYTAVCTHYPPQHILQSAVRGPTIVYTRKWIGNAVYIVYVTSLAILRMVTVRGKSAGVTNDKESVLL